MFISQKHIDTYPNSLFADIQKPHLVVHVNTVRKFGDNAALPTLTSTFRFGISISLLTHNVLIATKPRSNWINFAKVSVNKSHRSTDTTIATWDIMRPDPSGSN